MFATNYAVLWVREAVLIVQIPFLFAFNLINGRIQYKIEQKENYINSILWIFVRSKNKVNSKV